MKKRVFQIALGVTVYIVLISLYQHFENSVSPENPVSLVDAVWYSIITLSTVGYGDMYPSSLGGRIIGVMFVLGSVSILSALIGKVSNTIAQFREKKRMGQYGVNFENHILIIGWDHFAKNIAEVLLDANQKIAIVTDNKDEVDMIYELFDKKEKEVFVLFANLYDYKSFKKANITKSNMVFVNLQNDDKKLMAILNLKRHYEEKIKIMVILDESDLKDTFRTAGVTYALSKNEFVSKIMASYIFEPSVAEYTVDLISHAEGAKDFDIQEFKVTDGNKFIGAKYGTLFEEITREYRSLPIGLVKTEGDKINLLKLPSMDLTIEEGDYVIFINNGESYKALKKDIFKVEQGE